MPELPILIGPHDRVIIAVREQIFVGQGIHGGSNRGHIIRIDESSHIGIVVSGLQIVEIRFRIQIIPSVPERVHCADAVRIRQDGAVAPRRSRIASIAVGGDLGSSVVVYRDNVSEEVFFEEVEFNIYIRIKDR